MGTIRIFSIDGFYSIFFFLHKMATLISFMHDKLQS